jgi:hypothetical protein
MKQIGSVKKIENLMRNLAILLSDQLPHFHGQFATCGDWRKGWVYPVKGGG